jgi:hypothetical protein
MGLRSGESCGDPGVDDKARNVKISFALGTRTVTEGGSGTAGLVGPLDIRGDQFVQIADSGPGGGELGLLLDVEIGETVEKRRRCRSGEVSKYRSTMAVSTRAGRYIELKMRKVSGKRQAASANVDP